MNVNIQVSEYYANILRKRLPHGIRKIFYKSLVENFAREIEKQDEDFMKNLMRGFDRIQETVIDQQLKGLTSDGSEHTENQPDGALA